MTRENASKWALTAALAAAMGIITQVQAPLAAEHKRVKVKHDVGFLPPPKQLSAMSLGYRAALADILWAHVMVSQGLHSTQRRRFENLLGLYDGINELAPKWRRPYMLVDTLVTFQVSGTPRYEEVVRTREILERGVAERPMDAELWLNLGQFVAYIAAPSYLEETRPEVAKRWRIEGAEYLVRASELSGENSAIGWQSIGAARILYQAGRTDAVIRFLERTLAVTDDEMLKADLLQKLQHLNNEHDQYALEARYEGFRQLIQGEVRFITSRNLALALGPPFPPAACAGPVKPDQPHCATSWKAWSERFDKVGETLAPAPTADKTPE